MCRARVCTAALSAVVALMLAGCGNGSERGEGGSASAASSTPAASVPDSAQTAEKPAASSAGAPGLRQNRRPKARLEVLPPVALTGLTSLSFDASYSTDDFDVSSELLKRWDFDGDGTWDTGFTRGSRAGHVFSDSGDFRPRLLVIDSGGLADSTVGSTIHVRAPCPAPDFALADINPNSATFHKTYRLSELRGHRVLAWFTAPSG